VHRDAKGLADVNRETLNMLTLEPRELLATIVAAFKDLKDQKLFRDWLYKRYGAKKVAFRRDDAVFYRYVGIHRKPTQKAADKMNRNAQLLRLPLSTLSTVDTVST
jgi:hypothetical protein